MTTRKRKPPIELRVMFGEVDVTEYLRSFEKLRKKLSPAERREKHNAKRRKPKGKK